MAAKIGILGEGVSTSTGTVTLYTVPADKAARIRMIFVVENGASIVDYSILIGSPGSEITIHMTIQANNDLWSGTYKENTDDPTGSLLSGINGVQRVSGIIDLDDPTFDGLYWRAPLAADFFLSTGDTVKVTISNASPTDHLIQIFGVEDDA